MRLLPYKCVDFVWDWFHTNVELSARNTLVVKPGTYDPSCDLCSLALWTYDILYDYGIFLPFMMNLIKDL